MNTEKTPRNLEEILKDACKKYKDEMFSSYDVYTDILEMPKKNGRRRHYTLTYSQVKQRMARAKYLIKVDDGDDGRAARYKNKQDEQI